MVSALVFDNPIIIFFLSLISKLMEYLNRNDIPTFFMNWYWQIYHIIV
jgi:hypothetical protein